MPKDQMTTKAKFIEELKASKDQSLRDKTYDEIELWLAHGWDISDPYKIVRLNTSILEHVDNWLSQALDQQKQEMVEMVRGMKRKQPQKEHLSGKIWSGDIYVCEKHGDLSEEYCDCDAINEVLDDIINKLEGYEKED